MVIPSYSAHFDNFPLMYSGPLSTLMVPGVPRHSMIRSRLRFIRRALGDQVHFWPFDGWNIPTVKSVILEAYPKLWNASFPTDGRTPDHHDAYSVAAWLSQAARDGKLLEAMKPSLSAPEVAVAQVEGWILGVPWKAPEKQKGKARSAVTRGRSSAGKTTKPGYVNKNGQEVLKATDLPGNDHNQVVYVMSCGSCGKRYGANGSDIWQRRCAACGGGAAGCVFRSIRPPIPTTCAHLFRGIRPPVTRCREAACFGYQI
jgi:hypothetical protein